MGWLDRLRGPRYRAVAAVTDLGRGRVAIAGPAHSVDQTLRDPVTGEPCIAIEYRAWPPSTTVGIDGGTSFNARAYEVTASQAVSFVLELGGDEILIRVRTGEDVGAVHTALLERHGVGLRTERVLIPEGAHVRVQGKVVQETASRGSPHRAQPWVATVEAERFWLA